MADKDEVRWSLFKALVESNICEGCDPVIDFINVSQPWLDGNNVIRNSSGAPIEFRCREGCMVMD